jgi:hypothetical protein
MSHAGSHDGDLFYETQRFMTLSWPQKSIHLYSVGHRNLTDVGGHYVQMSRWYILFVGFISVKNIFITFV